MNMSNTELLKGNTSKQRIAPDFTLPDANGDPITLSKILGDGHIVILIFLRHLG